MTDSPTPPSSGGSARHAGGELMSMTQLIARSSLGARDARRARSRVRVQDAQQVIARAARIRPEKSGG